LPGQLPGQSVLGASHVRRQTGLAAPITGRRIFKADPTTVAHPRRAPRESNFHESFMSATPPACAPPATNRAYTCFPQDGEDETIGWRCAGDRCVQCALFMLLADCVRQSLAARQWCQLCQRTPRAQAATDLPTRTGAGTWRCADRRCWLPPYRERARPRGPPGRARRAASPDPVGRRGHDSPRRGEGFAFGPAEDDLWEGPSTGPWHV
jgi:hypothetical protein